MKCRGCSKDLADGDEVRMVAEWPFCPSCFENLMKGPGKPVEAPRAEEKPQAVQDSPEAAPAPARCSACKRELGPEEGNKLGIWNLCPECYRELAVMAGMDSTEEDGTETDAPVKAASDADAEAPEEKQGGIAGVTVGLASTVNCAGCGRRIRLGGSRTVDGKPYCPDCYYAMPEEKAQGPESGSPSVPDQPGGDAAPDAESRPLGGKDRCACCDHPLRSGFYGQREGFTLCTACLTTDPDLAVEIARERHRRLLARLKSDMGTMGPQ